ncbi:GLPGLI family protein [Myroides marinus]|uniref:GLPGLI family protein n=1 Tax=Myroides marinus TaxID=703342 RepID=UPI00257855DA|nr:GLPGLI family protein [Myroides marinus]MDM1346199.1 GLPGLI family protein [Myroides marinus]MDM1349541.1 GLPGLI family protein [Myroides marinus]MDM1353797.1 GLPGLI family protein [Myroides marinus]MDM1356751.1 GLPGLI family protein [Myroides marinus]MDM1363893.1 GLPGLI family protein [Myroides marinus]
MRIRFYLICITTTLFSSIIYAQKPNQNTVIEYITYSNNKIVNADDPITLIANENNAFIARKKQLDIGLEKFPYEQTFIDYKNKELYSIAHLTKKNKIRMLLPESKQNFTLHSETKNILGYNCKKATISINSNTLTLWYTNELKAKGSPMSLGANLGLVLEVDRNGTYKTVANKIHKDLKINLYDYLKLEDSKLVDTKTYKTELWNSRFTTIKLFEEDLVNFSDSIIEKPNLMRFAKGTVLVTKVKIPALKPTDQLFINLTEQSNGDAYDRTGSVFLIPHYHEISFMDALEQGVSVLPIYQNQDSTEKFQGVIATNNYTPPIELMRFFTPFGVKGFNHIEVLDYKWQDKAYYRQEITEFQPLLSNSEWYVGVYIGNYDKGGHKISADITIHPGGNDVASKTTMMMPLFNTTNLMEMAGQNYPIMFASPNGLKITFTTTTDIKNAKLRYITTGHGGWENGDEFNPKINTITLDDNKALDYFPWRQDCGSYRDYNPASGNFETGLSSSDLSRSNWCPGTVTPPIWIPLGDIKKGTHTIEVKIPQGKREGNSFSYWNVSGVLFGE